MQLPGCSYICNQVVAKLYFMETRRDVFQAIADPTRREILNLIARQSLTPNGVADNFDMSRQAISKHIKILAECGMIVIQKQGSKRYCYIQAEKLTEVEDWLHNFRKHWEKRFNKLDNVLTNMKQSKRK